MNRTPSEGWLSLRVVVPSPEAPRGKTPRIFISVPKKVIRLATRRNRVKRLLREAIRLDGRFIEPSREYHFRVQKAPAMDGLPEAARSVKRLADTTFKEKA